MTSKCPTSNPHKIAKAYVVLNDSLRTFVAPNFFSIHRLRNYAARVSELSRIADAQAHPQSNYHRSVSVCISVTNTSCFYGFHPDTGSPPTL